MSLRAILRAWLWCLDVRDQPIIRKCSQDDEARDLTPSAHTSSGLFAAGVPDRDFES
jgi:hypothetical protein